MVLSFLTGYPSGPRMLMGVFGASGTPDLANLPVLGIWPGLPKKMGELPPGLMKGLPWKLAPVPGNEGI